MFFFIFFSPRDLRAPLADRRETLPRYRKALVFDKLGPKIWGPLPRKKVGGQKRAKFGSISDHFKIRSRISPERIETSKIAKISDRERFLPRSAKSPVNFGLLTTSHYMWTLTHPNRLFRKTIFRPLGPCYEKNGEVWSTNQKVIGAHVDPPKVRLFE